MVKQSSCVLFRSTAVSQGSSRLTGCVSAQQSYEGLLQDLASPRLQRGEIREVPGEWLRFHPTRTRIAQHEEKFKEIAEALRSQRPKKRVVYDQLGERKDHCQKRPGRAGLSPLFENREAAAPQALFRQCHLYLPRNPATFASFPGGPTPPTCSWLNPAAIALNGFSLPVTTAALRAGPLDMGPMATSAHLGGSSAFGRDVIPGEAGEEGHAHFKRDGSNIIYNCKISLKEALCGCTVSIPTLENRVISPPHDASSSRGQ
ncbi:dnaJ homolog subfamily B member 5 [Lates japonicus]|uniref:DnaJ homolog subfamily B member 5 n=1 Tax=Lates japonicus TaxID=270547 RepID=A0AAD3R1L8_LATJO|nr:dnaJ homolog subfamily B member 5 [Lates japonicus]